MIRTSKHNISKHSNDIKLEQLDCLFDSYKVCLKFYIEMILNGDLPLKKNLSSKDLPFINIKHSRYKQLIYKQASEIIRSSYKKSNSKRFANYKKIYKYFVNNDRQNKFINKKYSDLNLKDLVYSKYFIKPNINNITINLDERFFDVKQGNSFDNYVKIILPLFNEKGTRALKVHVPLKQHKHSNNLKLKGFKLKKVIQLKKVNNKMFINLIWEKGDVPNKTQGNALGIDMGYKKLITTSEGDKVGLNMEALYASISNKQQGSINFKKSLTHRDNEINRIINKMDLSNVNVLMIEDLKNVKYKSKFSKKFNNKLQRWSYKKCIDKLERICDELGIKLVKVSPAYTSQTCSFCGDINKKSRKGEQYKCISCGYEEDADVNASINIRNKGVYSLLDTIKG